MFDFIQKAEIWETLDQGLAQELDHKNSFQLKTIQDLAVYKRLRDLKGKTVAEVVGSTSRILHRLSTENVCLNIDRAGLIQNTEFEKLGIKTIASAIGDFDPDIPASHFDVVFSTSVVEHIPFARLDLFNRDQIRILKPGGMFIHAIGFYVEDAPNSEWTRRYEAYKSWLTGDADVEPVGVVTEGSLALSASMATNPDNILYGWGSKVASLRQLRTHAQHVSLLVAGQKVAG